MLLLFLCCALGLCAGYLLDHFVSQAQHDALRQYLQQYADAAVSGVSAVSVVFAYLRDPLLLLVFGAVSVVFVPLVCLWQGFALSFSVCAFVSALGHKGVLLALTALGIRCLVTLPCTFAMALALLENGGRKRKPSLRGGLWMLLLLAAGVLCELRYVPMLLQWALGKVF